MRARECEQRVVRYRIGDGELEVVSNDLELLVALEAAYGECGCTAGASGPALVGCRAELDAPRGVLDLSFMGARLPDPVDMTLALFRPERRWQCFVEVAEGPERRRLVNVKRHRLLIESDGTNALVHLEEAPAGLVPNLLIAMLQWAQPDVAFVHAASIGVDGSAALLVGPSRAGKSTLALTLGRRGHSVFADDVSALRLTTGEVIACRRTAALRTGTPGSTLDVVARRIPHWVETAADGSVRSRVRIADVVPASGYAAKPLRSTFFLDRFAASPALRPLSRTELERRGANLAHEETVVASWGPSRARQLMRYLRVADLVAGSECFAVELGGPEETADVIERAMEDRWD